MHVETSLLVPGPWKSREELAAALDALRPEDGPRCRVEGELLADATTGEGVLWHWQVRHPELARSFELAGQGALEAAELEAVTGHAGCAVLTDSEGGSPVSARRLLAFGEALLRAGGCAVLVEGSGLAHGAAAWRELASQAGEPEALLLAFVASIGEPDLGFFTCGMHALGLPDVAVPPALDPEGAGALLDAFTFYLLAEEPELQDGDAFAAAEGEPAWELQRRPCEHLDADDPLHNPFGLWWLLPIAEE